MRKCICGEELLDITVEIEGKLANIKIRCPKRGYTNFWK